MDGGWTTDGARGHAAILRAARSREAQNVWTLGAQCTTGPITVSLGYLNAQDAGSLTTVGKLKTELFTIGAKYVVAPGLSVGPEFDHFKIRSDVAGGNDKGNIFLARTDLAF